MAAADGQETMQRVRVGLTGLAFVLLIVALVSVIFDAAIDEAPVVPGIDLSNIVTEPPPAVSVTNGLLEQPKPEPAKPAEPLAELGVAPSSATTDANSSASALPPASDVRPRGPGR